MVNSLLASLALFGASAAAQSVGAAVVVNKCTYPVTLCNVPASGGGYEQQEQSLAPGQSWTQTWTSLTNGDGWSIKLSKTEGLENILQYEYTFHNDGIIWYDLSCVNGNPWDQDWEITAAGADCSPKQQAYRFATDDAYGMQSCPSSAVITVSLCTGVSADEGNSTGSGSPAPSYSSSSSNPPAPAYTAPSPPPVYSAPPPPPPPVYTAPSPSASTPTPLAASYFEPHNKVQKGPKVTPTTLSTSTTAAITSAPAGATVVEVVTVYATEYVTAYERRRRHDHAHHHQHDA